MTPKQWLGWTFESITGWRFHVEMRRKAGEVYMHRWQLLKTRLLSIYVNKICLPDEDELLHTHPWRASWSVKLKGKYVQQLPGVIFDQPPRFSRIPEQHRIVHLREGKPVWTLFIGWRSDRGWGFVANDGAIIPWRARAAQREMPLDAFSGGQQR